MVKRIKSYCDKPIVVGVPQMNTEGANILKDIPELDFAMVGESDHGIVKFVGQLRTRVTCIRLMVYCGGMKREK